MGSHEHIDATGDDQYVVVGTMLGVLPGDDDGQDSQGWTWSVRIGTSVARVTADLARSWLFFATPRSVHDLAADEPDWERHLNALLADNIVVRIPRTADAPELERLLTLRAMSTGFGAGRRSPDEAVYELYLPSVGNGPVAALDATDYAIWISLDGSRAIRDCLEEGWPEDQTAEAYARLHIVIPALLEKGLIRLDEVVPATQHYGGDK